MKMRLILLFCLASVMGWGQFPPPITRGPWTTNVIATNGVSFTATNLSKYTVVGNTNTDGYVTKTEVLDPAGWTPGTWTGDNTTGWNSAGLTITLANSAAAVANAYYEISYNIATWTQGRIRITFGGVATSIIYGQNDATAAFMIKASTTGTFSVLSQNSFDGTVVFSVRSLAITARTPLLSLQSSDYVSKIDFDANIGTNNNMFIGYNIGDNAAIGLRNLGLGINLFTNTVIGHDNVAIGYNSQKDSTSGYDNISIGSGSLEFNTTGYDNIAIGIDTLRSNATAHSSTAVGYGALRANTANGNSAFGKLALNENIVGTASTALGYLALTHFTNSANTAVGYNALHAVTSGSYNTAVGNNAGSGLQGQYNTVVGYGSLLTTTGDGNSVFGNSAALTTGTFSNNCVMGSQTLYKATNASMNVALGVETMYYAESGNWNTAIGTDAMIYSTTSEYNTAVGAWALSDINTGGYNTAIGYHSGVEANNLTNTITIGQNVHATNSNQIVLGPLTATQTILRGDVILTDTNTLKFSGVTFLRDDKTDNNSYVGAGAGDSSSGNNYSVGVGTLAMGGSSDADRSVGVGYSAGFTTVGSNNVLIGYSTSDMRTGGEHVIIGSDTTFSNSTTNTIGIGYSVTTTNSNDIVIGNQWNTNTYLSYNVFAGGVQLASYDYIDSLIGQDVFFYLRGDLTGYTTNFLMLPTYNAAASTTNTSAALADGDYAFTYTTTNAVFAYVGPGLAQVEFTAYRSGTPDTLTVKPEIYLRTNSIDYFEFPDASVITLTATKTTYRSTVNLSTNAPLYANSQVCVKFKAITTASSPIMYLVSGSNDVSVVTLPSKEVTGGNAYLARENIFTVSNQFVTGLSAGSIYVTNFYLVSGGTFTSGGSAGTDGQVLTGNTGDMPIWTDRTGAGVVVWSSGATVTNFAMWDSITVKNANIIGPLSAISTIDTTNYVVDFNLMDLQITATGNIALVQSTNRLSTSTNSVGTCVRILASGANITVNKNASWKTVVGSATWPLVITNGDWGLISLKNYGSSETNVVIGGSYAH